MEILSFESLRESDHFMELCPASHTQFSYMNHIGAITIKPGTKTSWYWVQSGKRIDFTLKFLIGNPDNTNEREHCLGIINNRGECSYNDVDCNWSECKFLCQTKLEIEN